MGVCVEVDYVSPSDTSLNVQLNGDKSRRSVSGRCECLAKRTQQQPDSGKPSKVVILSPAKAGGGTVRGRKARCSGRGRNRRQQLRSFFSTPGTLASDVGSLRPLARSSGRHKSKRAIGLFPSRKSQRQWRMFNGQVPSSLRLRIISRIPLTKQK